MSFNFEMEVERQAYTGDHAEAVAMLQTIEVTIDKRGVVCPVEHLARIPTGRALLTLLPSAADEAALLAETALAEDWLRPEEDDAWAHLQPGK